VDGNSADRRVGRKFFQEATHHSVWPIARIAGTGNGRVLPSHQIIRSCTIIGSATL
jgi:hypothetical protein